MKVFLSWSGEQSRDAAITLKNWLPFVIHAVKPYVSSEDIEKGARWSLDIAKELESSSYGILCMTPENLTAPWIHFEAGALSRMLDVSRVTPLLIGLKQSDVHGPLQQFQMTVCQREDIWQMVTGLNRTLAPQSLDEHILRGTFDMFWPKLEAALKKIEGKNVRGRRAPQNNRDEVLDEILALLRDQQKFLRSPQGLSRVDRAAEALEAAAREIVYRGETRVPPEDQEESEEAEGDDRLDTRTTVRRRQLRKG